MSKKNRAYQVNALTEIYHALGILGHRCIIVCQPTGTGKTVVFSQFCATEVAAGKIPMVLVNRSELLEQADEKMQGNGVYPVLINPDHKPTPGQAYVASIETLNRREMPYVDYIICDEIHIEQHDKIIEKYLEQHPHVKVIGFTATPIREKGTSRPLHRFFTHLIETIDTPTAIAEGYLVRAVTFGAQLDLEKVAKTKNGEYQEAALFAAYNKSGLYDGVVSNYRRFADGKKGICFNINVEHSQAMARRFNQAGITAAHVDGTTPKNERKRIREAFARGEIRMLCNCGVFTTGFDDPGIEVVILNRATTSLALYLQMCGRGSRPICNVNFDTVEERLAAIEQSTKDKFIIIDHGSNWTRHGYWSAAREWSLKPERKKPAGVAPTRFCPSCEAIINQSARWCEWCEYEIPYEKRLQELLSSEFVKLEAELMPPELLTKQLVDLTIPELELYRKFKDYHVHWCVQQLRLQAKHLALIRSVLSDQDIKPDAIFTQLMKLYAAHKGYNHGWRERFSYHTKAEPEQQTEQVERHAEITLELFQNLV